MRSSSAECFLTALHRRQEQLTGEIRMKVNALEGKVEAQVEAQDDMQLKVQHS